MNLPQKAIIFCVERECVLRLDGSSFQVQIQYVEMQTLHRWLGSTTIRRSATSRGYLKRYWPVQHAVASSLESARLLSLNFWQMCMTISVAITTIADEQFWWHRASIRRHYCWRAILVTSHIYPSCCLPFYIWSTTSSSNGSVLWMSRRSATSSVWSRSKASLSL